MSDPVKMLRSHIAAKGYTHWRVTATGHYQPRRVTAYKTSQRHDVQLTLRGEPLAVSFRIDALEQLEKEFASNE